MKISEKQRLLIVVLQLVTIALLLMGKCNAQTTTWETIDTGFEIGKYQSPLPSDYGNGIVTILKIDPNGYEFSILHEHGGKTAPDWAKEHKFLAVVNAGMFNGNHKNMGYMKNYDDVTTSHMNQDNAVLALNPINGFQPSAQIIDLKAQNWYFLKSQYNSFTQSIRMVDINSNNLWSKSHRIWSVIVVAMDKSNNILFIHSRTPYTMHEFINTMLEAPLDIRNMMYLEGGPEASLYINNCNREIRCIGSYETNFYDDSNIVFWPIPNIIGVIKKE